MEEFVWKVNVDCITNAINICSQINLIKVQCFLLIFNFWLKVQLITVLLRLNFGDNCNFIFSSLKLFKLNDISIINGGESEEKLV